jgi:hypothetical protein
VAWAKQNLPPSSYLPANQFSFQIPDDSKLTLRYGFPYFAGKPASEDVQPIGYVCGRYDADNETFSQLRKQAEF